ncbi:hypothetical protein [Bradyrhizobium sp. JYMT SZCCT0428]|uniref:hypothetical protein n=1 Tax=Bradyrhizobium sp. JYMT SZCCT0428 TaxID=2807673 RepID=UPI001BA454F5|nr:hypothetical protein [Bradyrhizobium sp. JYMT SZCCT0428]MBR1150084.1 hypothetical protein [Bradyrhizobium sp. JYMT SZCCT0428]
MFGRYFAARYFGRRYFGGSGGEPAAPLVPDPLLTLKNRFLRSRQLSSDIRVRSLAARRRRQRSLD